MARFKAAIRPLRRFHPFLRPHRRTLVFVTLLLGLESAFTLLQPLFYGLLVDQVLASALPVDGLGPLILMLVPLAIIRLAAWFVSVQQQILRSRLARNVAMDVENAVYRQLDALPVSWHDRHPAGENLRHLYGDPSHVTAFLIEVVPAGLDALVRSAIALAAITATLWWAGLVALLPVLPVAGLAVWSGARFQRFSQISFARSKRLYLHVLDLLRGVRLVRVFGRSNEERARFERHQRHARDAQLAQARNEAWLSPALALLSRTGGLAVFVAGAVTLVRARAAGQDDFTLGQLTMLMGYVWQLAQPIARIGQLASGLGDVGAAAGRLVSILEAPLEPAVANGRTVDPTQPAVIFDHVCFGYRPEQHVLKDVSLVLRRGEAVALTGPNGAGKTTLVNLLCGFYVPTSGRVLVEGRPAGAAVAQRCIALAPQDAPLFQRTLRQNLTFGRSDATDQEIHAALELVRLTAAVAALPRGLNTPMGEGSDTFSAGQKQRLSLARALLARSPVLVLDEAMSWIDAADRAHIWNALLALEHRPALLIVTHQERLPVGLHRILTIADGTVHESASA